MTRAGVVAGICCALTALALSASAGVAQGLGTATVTGVVTDSTGQPVSAALVELHDEDRGARAETLTDDAGRFRLAGLAPGGTWVLTVTRIGFAEARRTGLLLHGGTGTRVAIRLATAATELDPIAVRVARAATIDASRTGAVTLLDERIVRTTPTVTRNAVDLAALAPLVTLDDRTLAIAGQSHRFNSMRIDGALNQDVFGLSPSGVPGGEAYAKPLPLDAVQQYQILVAPFDVRQSGFTGGVLNAVTRAGTNQWQVAASGFYRDAFFTGTPDERDASTAADGDFASRLVALSVGGPVRRDRTHVFAAAELEWRRRPVPGFSVGAADPLLTGLVPDSVSSLTNLLRDGYGVDAGAAGGYRLENPLANVFARVDHRLSDAHRLVGRYSFARARNDGAARRAPAGVYELASSARELASRTHAASLQLVSRLRNDLTAEMMVNFQQTRDRTRPNAEFPQLEVLMRGELEDGMVQRPVRAGAAATAQVNELDQNVLQLSAVLTRAVGRHALTAGADLDRFAVRHLFVPSAYGAWQYDGLAQLRANAPSAYERTVVLEPDARLDDATVTFALLQPAVFLQDEWSAGTALTLTFGVRLDLPLLPDDPEANAELEDLLPSYTAELPAARPLLSPRLGFNWQRSGALRTQVRGGVGLFTGRPPLNLVANAYAHTGLRTALLACTSAVPLFDPAAPAPATCADGGAPLERQVVFFGRGVHFPQDWRGSIALDQELPGGFIVTLEGVYTRARHQLELRDRNIMAVPEIAELPGYTDGYGNRLYYGVPTLPAGYAPRRALPGYAHILEVTNGPRNSAFGASIELRRQFAERLDVRAAYSYSGSYDTRSLGYPDAGRNFGMTALRYDPNRPELTYSDYHRPHKIVVNAWSRISSLGDGTELGLTWLGQSGRPYSYVYASDVNGDGYPGRGALADAHNDLVYVPAFVADIPAGLASAESWNQLVELDPCLRASRGTVPGRNVCTAPWANLVNVQLTQGARVAGRRIRLSADVMNVLNLLNDTWGVAKDVEPRVPVLLHEQRFEAPPRSDDLGEQWVAYIGPRARDAASGRIAPVLPYTPAYPDSHWRAQLGVRIEF